MIFQQLLSIRGTQGESFWAAYDICAVSTSLKDQLAHLPSGSFLIEEDWGSLHRGDLDHFLLGFSSRGAHFEDVVRNFCLKSIREVLGRFLFS